MCGGGTMYPITMNFAEVNESPIVIICTEFGEEESALQASVFRNFHFFGVIFSKNQKHFAASAEIPAKTKMLNNFLLAHNRP